MKWFFTSIVFCLLLLPGIGSGQGIGINDEGYFLYNGYDSLFREKKLCAIKIFNQSNTIVYQLFFKHNSRIKKALIAGGENVIFFHSKSTKNNTPEIKET